MTSTLVKPRFRILPVLALGALFAARASLFAQGTAFTYQARLSDNGLPANGSYDLRFGLFSLSNAGNQVGSSITNSATAVAGGLFTVALDFGPGIFTGSNLWLEVGVRTNGSANGFTILSPRQAVLPAPYAIMANTASNLTGSVGVSSTNTPNTIVKRDNSGSFSAASITLSGSLVANDVQVAGGSQSVVSSLGTTRLIWGGVHADGSIAFGTGFTVTRTTVGTYAIGFSAAFSNVPAVLFSPPYGQSTGWTTTFGSLAADSVVIKSYNGTFQADADFAFAAIGPR